jgi:hypothetical protein
VGVNIGGMRWVQPLEFADSGNGGLKCLRRFVNRAGGGETRIAENALAIHSCHKLLAIGVRLTEAWLRNFLIVIAFPEGRRVVDEPGHIARV